MKISIGRDHAAFQQKEQVREWLAGLGHDVVDRGCYSEDRVDYPDIAHLVADDVARGEAERGVLLCGTGIGMTMAAGKVAGIRAANLTNAEFAQLSREHNDANVATLSGRFVDLDTNKQILEVFLSTDFAGGRHAARVQKIG